ncbi:MAG: DNA-binding response regulator [Acidobacteria bacterium]|nr:MAG: DNA-binding response regulator [Acidobacteriota bacterium]
MSTVRILIADDHEVVRRGVRTLLESQPGWVVSGEAATGREATEKVTQLKPDVVILDISMPDLNGLEATRHIVRNSPKTKVLLFTIHESERVMAEMLEAGALGYVLKSDAAESLVAAVRALRQGKPFFTCRMSEMVLKGYLKRGTRNGEVAMTPRDLSPRERAVVQLLVEGKRNKEIASALGISVRTAESHRANIMRKLELHSVTELVRYAIHNKIVEP